MVLGEECDDDNDREDAKHSIGGSFRSCIIRTLRNSLLHKGNSGGLFLFLSGFIDQKQNIRSVDTFLMSPHAIGGHFLGLAKVGGFPALLEVLLELIKMLDDSLMSKPVLYTLFIIHA